MGMGRISFVILLVISQQLFAGKIPVEISFDDTFINFEADLSLPDYGSFVWCKEHNANVDCVNALTSSIPTILNARKKGPQSLIDGESSSNLHSVFENQNACTDNFHVTGRCMLLRSLSQYIVNGQVPGDYVEAGVHIGDSAAAVAQVFISSNSKKKLYLYDSFAGMPEAILEVDGTYATTLSPSHDELGRGWGHEASAQGVLSRLTSLGLPQDQIVIREGWFNATFCTPPKPLNQVAFLMVDGDWYDSVLDTLNTFYDDVPVGGVVVLDDYGYWEGARKALGAFLRSRPDIEMPLFERYGPDILWWVKSHQHNRP